MNTLSWTPDSGGVAQPVAPTPDEAAGMTAEDRVLPETHQFMEKLIVEKKKKIAQLRLEVEKEEEELTEIVKMRNLVLEVLSSQIGGENDASEGSVEV